MPFDDTMASVMRWATATEALAALGAELAVQQPGVAPAPEIVRALHEVSTAAGVADACELPAPQRAMVLALIRMYVHQAADLLDHPDRAPGWEFTDAAILDGWGRGSAMVPALIASAHADLADVTRFLDVGTGVGLLAVAAAHVWPASIIVGIDPWGASLERARTNIDDAGLAERIQLRRERLTEIDDVDTYDCVWIPSFFLSDVDLEKGLVATRRALRRGGWVALGLMRTAPDPLVAATAALRTLRGGGCTLDTNRALALLNDAGYDEVHAVQPPGPAPLELVLGQRARD